MMTEEEIELAKERLSISIMLDYYGRRKVLVIVKGQFYNLLDDETPQWIRDRHPLEERE